MENKGNILIVDDDITILKFIKTVLENNGYLVRTAETAKGAIQKCEKDYYELAIRDIRLPDMEGTELLRAIHNITKYFLPTSCVMLTGFPSQQNAIDSLNFGADFYMVKPIKPKDLLEIVKATLDKRMNSQTMMMNLLTKYINLLKSEQLETTIDKIAKRLNSPKQLIEKMTIWGENAGFLKYWKDKGTIERLAD
jgi:DNA-binding response OmpR family regulator